MSHHDGSTGDLGRRVAHRRQALGLTREELARRSGMASGYLAYLEEQPAKVAPAALARLAAALETTEEELLGGAAERPPGRDGVLGEPRLVELDEAECLRLISPGGVGRIAFTGRFGITVLPVNYRVQHGTIVFRTAAGGATDEDLRTGMAGVEYVVAFEVDRIDEVTAEGWSVLIRGALHHVTSEEEQASAAETGVRPWAGGERELYLRVIPAQITGRRILSG